MLLTDAIRRYQNARTAEGYSPCTIKSGKSAFKGLLAFMESLEIVHIEQMDQRALQRFREGLSWHQTAKGTPLTLRSQSEILGHLRAFCRWMVEQDWLVADPSKKIQHPRIPQRFPKVIMDQDDVQRIMAQPNLQTAQGYRDRVILEVLYSSAVRRDEAARLLLDDVDTEHGFLMVREGKYRKDRAVPIGASVCKLLESYITGVRADWMGAEKYPHLFLNRFGQGLGPATVARIVRQHSRAAGIDKPISTHTFRHSCATHMVRAGASIRHLQEMLGHESIQTTQIYAQLTINDVKAAHSRYHPREREGASDRTSKD